MGGIDYSFAGDLRTMAKKTPLQQVTEQHGDKEKLVDKLTGMVDRGEESKDELKGRLKSAPNSKLLRLYAVMTEIKDQFGNTEKLVDALLELMNRSKDKDYRDKLLSYSPNRLMDMYKVRKKKGKAA